MHYERILAAVAGTPWAIEPNKGQILADFLTKKARGLQIPEHEIKAAVSQRRSSGKKQSGGSTIVVPVHGVLSPRATFMTEVSGLTSMQQIGVWVDDAAANPDVSAIVLHIDSPGGAVAGTYELGDKVAAAAKKKRVVAVADGLCCSAAYWIAAQASEIVVSPSATIGSVGVYQLHIDQSEANKKDGVSVSFIQAGERKTAGHPHGPLDAIGREELQRGVDDAYHAFVKAVAKGRNTTQANVRETYGKGGTMRAEQAVRVGMADRIGSVDSVLAPYGLRMTDEGPEYISASAITPRPSASSGNVGIELRRRRLQLDKQQQAATTSTATATRPSTTSHEPHPHSTFTSYHEAGHLLVRHLLGDSQATASIVPTDTTWGHVQPGKRLGLFSEACACYAGEVGGDYSPQQPSAGARPNSGDQEQLNKLGLDPAYRYVDARNAARKLVGNNVGALHALAGQLHARRTLSANETREILSGFSLNPW
ncbi:MAG: hypothetical protein C0467_32710 [Planctomycetaceae bacterium]|nr:hypothetical protein [Planctomycetaceae bacterium]